MRKAICPDERRQISRKPHRSKSSDKDYASIKKGGKQFRRSFKTFHFRPRMEHGSKNLQKETKGTKGAIKLQTPQSLVTDGTQMKHGFEGRIAL
jgi:hypothetical protein